MMTSVNGRHYGLDVGMWVVEGMFGIRRYGQVIELHLTDNNGCTIRDLDGREVKAVCEWCSEWLDGEHYAEKRARLDEFTPDWRELKYPNGKPQFASSGMMLDEHGNRSIFDYTHHVIMQNDYPQAIVEGTADRAEHIRLEMAMKHYVQYGYNHFSPNEERTFEVYLKRVYWRVTSFIVRK